MMQIRSLHWLLAVSLAGAVGSLAPAATAAGSYTALMSVDSLERPGNAVSDSTGVSDDGRYVVFSSDLPLAVTDRNAVSDVYVRDRQTGRTRMVSVKPPGVRGKEGAYRPVMSGNGRYVAFSSGDELVPGQPFGIHAYVRDLTTESTRAVDLLPDGTHVPYEKSDTGARLRMSRDGRFIAYGIDDDSSSYEGIAVRDMVTDTIRTFPAPQGYLEDISDAGDVVVFSSISDGIVPGDTNHAYDIFIRNLTTSTTTRVLSTSGEPPELHADSFEARISGDGRLIAFQSNSATLAGPGRVRGPRLLLHDRSTGATTVLAGATALDIAMSADGRWVAYTDERPGEGKFGFLRDLTNGATEVITRSTTNIPGGGSYVDGLSVSPDGRFVSFLTDASLSPADSNGDVDAYLRDRGA